MTRLARIEAAIRSTNDRRVLRLLNRAWWVEWFEARDAKSTDSQFRESELSAQSFPQGFQQ